MKENRTTLAGTLPRIALCAIAGAYLCCVTSSTAYDIDPASVEYLAGRTAPGEGTWVVLKGSFGYPTWEFDDQSIKSKLVVPNQARPDLTKVVTMVLFFGDGWDETVPTLTLGGGTLAHHDVSLGSKTAIWEWTMFPQPASETITFPGWYGYDMHNGMTGMKVGTVCIPEPSICGLAGLGMLLLAWRRPAVRD
ncbi:MAG TPA: hypothetical protein P5205_04725 [Candidatus Paceibacterota bacterium]|nr:hypothetical protein [Verrucomicrobiota bacterium]HSA09656.1 hypothetical protein [Candidatus Paceibacterota bacterium]